jgi:hypothetical protein
MGPCVGVIKKVMARVNPKPRQGVAKAWIRLGVGIDSDHINGIAYLVED